MAGKHRKVRAKSAGGEGASVDGGGQRGAAKASDGRSGGAARQADQVRANVKQARADIEGRPRTDDEGAPGANSE